MRIMYIVNGFGLSEQIGGSTTRSIEIAKRLKEKGHEIHFLTTIGGFKACKREGLNARYHVLLTSLSRIKERGIFDRFIAYVLSVIASFVRMPKLPPAQIVYTDSDFFCDVIPAVMFKLRFKNAKWAAASHLKIPVRKNLLKDFSISATSHILQEISYYLIRKFSDMLLTLKSEMGRSIRDSLVSRGYKNSKVKLVLNGVDFKTLRLTPNRGKKFDACFLGGMRLGKGHSDIVPIWKEVTRMKKDATLIVIGGGPKDRVQALKKEILSNGLEKNIQVLGFIENKSKVFNYLKQSKIFLATSHEESWGISICEAMATGLPVVAWDLQVYHNIYPKGMVRIPFGNHKEFATQIIRLLKDKQLRQKLSKDAQKVASSYDWDKIAEEELTLLQKLLKHQ